MTFYLKFSTMYGTGECNNHKTGKMPVPQFDQTFRVNF
jgi:hypothetical protein